MSSEVALSRELRGWFKLLHQGKLSSSIRELDGSLSTLHATLNSLNKETKKSSKFLGQITRIQQSIAEQTKAANWLAKVIVGFAALQVFIMLVK